ncbi:hypothetical protein [Streptomyces sp. JW3]|uniref:hypothetical protein n=1 Tax=Streptomyces sp. JW3 TaxID=3456955 RepID=UPI003FA441F7
MEIHLQNSRHERVSDTIGDDFEGSFLLLCRQAPESSVLHGVQTIGDTMFNELQCQRLAAELSSLPETHRTQVIRRVMEMAQQAASYRGYLYVTGD